MDTGATQTSSHKILIVEDETALATMLSDKFEAEGFQTKVAGDGEQGLATALEWQPTLILLDIVMPKMDGMTMLHKLREEEKGKNIPVILLTNLSDTEKVYDAVASGVYDYLVKANWDVDRLVHEVKNKLTLAK